MSGLIPPHGGGILVNRIVYGGKQDELAKKAAPGKFYIISDAEMSIFYRIADGTLSPLEGPMSQQEFYGVLDKESIERNGREYSWTIHIAFPILKKNAEALSAGEILVVKNEAGYVLGLLEISDIYYFDKEKYNRIVYGTERKDHPGPRIFNDDPRDYLLGGKIWAFGAQINGASRNYLYSPAECRGIFRERGWERIVAFQTRNPLHRAHEYAMVYAAETMARKNIASGVVLNPLVGKTKSDDVPAEVRMRTYEALVNQRLIGQGDRDETFWKSKGKELCDDFLLIALDMRMYYAGPKEAIMHAIYRQNMGFTDIIIGRKHADAPFDDGSPAWCDFDAQEKFENLKGELLIKPFKVGTACYFEELGRVDFEENHKGKCLSQVALSGKELRRKLEKGERIEERVMRKPVSDILFEAYRQNIGEFRQDIASKNIVWHDSGVSKKQREDANGHKAAVIWLTGLSCSGKSTIAVGLQNELFKMGCSVFILDGDNIRHGLNRDLGFSQEDRVENIRRIGEVAKLFCEAGFIVLTAFI